MRVHLFRPPWPSPREGRLVRALTLLGTLAALGAAAAPAAAAPPAPANLAVSPAESATSADTAVATWTVPGGAPAGTEADWKVTFSPAGEDYFLNLSGTSDQDGRAEIPLAREGTYSGFSVALRDAQGPGPEATVPHRLLVDRSAPGAPTVWHTGGMANWTDAPDRGAPIARAHWRYCRGWFGSPIVPAPVCVEGVATTSPFALSETAPPLGPAPGTCNGVESALSIWLEDAAGNGSPANAGKFGTAVTPACPAPPRDTPPAVEPPAAGPARKATTLAVTGRTLARRRGASGRRVRLVVALPRDAGGRVRLRVSRRAGGPRFVRTRSVQVRRGHAVATFTVPAGVRKLSVRATYAATATHAAASKNTTVRVGR
ncbi:hypothetical protein [Patulibacter americanus]|uniref:hypothetical protein n=1 Tax=Patulibacter americanus TaxID=588672 RepID=UPI0012FB8DAF|nr:hypothetical protein [Patulibacter americanus]